MNIECNCGQVKAQIPDFPNETLGRIVCYCDSCQNFANKIGRADLLDSSGGSEIVVIYPKNLKIVEGKDKLACSKLSPNGILRWHTSCCNTPFGNMKPDFPWLGLLTTVFKNVDLDELLGLKKVCVHGKFATGPVGPEVPEKMSLKGMLKAFPFVLKGVLLKKSGPSVYIDKISNAPIVEPVLLPR